MPFREHWHTVAMERQQAVCHASATRGALRDNDLDGCRRLAKPRTEQPNCSLRGAHCALLRLSAVGGYRGIGGELDMPGSAETVFGGHGPNGSPVFTRCQA